MSAPKPPRPEEFNTGDMKRDWDARARACAREYILTGFADEADAFARTGREAAGSLLSLCPPGAVVLDLGCGVGRVAREMEPHVARLHAVDVSEEMIRQARDYVGPGSRIQFHVNDGCTIPHIGDGSVDFAFALLTMHHVTRPAFESYLREVHRVLAPGGLFCFSVVSRDRSPAYEVDDHRDTFTGRSYSDAELDRLFRDRFEVARRWFTESGEGAWRVTYVNLLVRKLAEPAPRWWAVTGGPLRGAELLLRPGAPPWQAEMREGRFEAFLHDAVADEALAGRVVWDVGAHVGYHTLAFAARVGPAGRVIAFEPNPHNAARLRQNLAHNRDLAERVRLEPMALSDEDGAERLFHTAVVDDGTSSGAALESALTDDNRAAYRALEAIVVDVSRADSLVRAGRAAAPALVKIDVEGGELRVLRGGAELLATARPLLLIEVHDAAARSAIGEMLAAHGYALTVLSSDRSSARCHVLARPRGSV
jgi:FkbM family methyltransferase